MDNNIYINNIFNNDISDTNNCTSTTYNKECKLGGISLTLYATVIAIVLAKDLTPDQMGILSSFLQAIGQNLSVISTYESTCQGDNNVITPF